MEVCAADRFMNRILRLCGKLHYLGETRVDKKGRRYRNCTICGRTELEPKPSKTKA